MRGLLFIEERFHIVSVEEYKQQQLLILILFEEGYVVGGRSQVPETVVGPLEKPAK